MGIIFKKNGRPTKKEKLLLKNINSHISNMKDSDSFDFDNENVTEGERLEEIWNSITNVEEIVETKEVKTSINNEDMSNTEDQILEEANEGLDSTDDLGVPSSFNPLSEPIKQRSYNAQAQTNVGEIEEPIFDNQTSAQEKLEEIEAESEYEFEESEEPLEEESGSFENVSNPQMEELDNKDKKLAAKQLVQTVLDGYEMLHEVGKNFVKYPEEKLQEKIINQEIDPTMEIPLDENGNTTNPVEFFQSFNEQAEEAISYDPEFGDKVRPAMERVFAKKGWGMTDEQYLLIAFGKDIAWKSVQIMNLKKTANGIMNTFEKLQKDKIEAIRQQGRAQRPTQVTPDSIVTPPSRAEARQEEVGEEVEINDDNETQSTDIVPIH